jgi:hypothetical protein
MMALLLLDIRGSWARPGYGRRCWLNFLERLSHLFAIGDR